MDVLNLKSYKLNSKWLVTVISIKKTEYFKIELIPFANLLSSVLLLLAIIHFELHWTILNASLTKRWNVFKYVF